MPSKPFCWSSYFANDGSQPCLIFEPLYYTGKRLGDTENVLSWKCKGLLTKKLTTSTATDNSLSPSIIWSKNSNFCLIFKGSCLKKKKKKMQLLILQI